MDAARMIMGIAMMLLIASCTSISENDDPESVSAEPWIQNLRVPWSLVFLDGDTALVSERLGRIRLIEDGKLVEEPYMELEVNAEGEGGLMGLAKHPDFPTQQYIYAMYTYREDVKIYNKVIRIKHEGARGTFDKTIIDKIPGASNHNGGRIAFGPDGMLYIATGETFNRRLAQDLNSSGGKILRLTADGEIPSDNPFGTAIYSYGHRNPQGLAWHPETGAMFESEHGPSGEKGSAHDELNIIQKGKNYGWPEVIGAPGNPNYVDPMYVWPDTATPPGGIAFLNGKLYVATLRSQTLIEATLEKKGDSYVVKGVNELFKNRYGRLRDVVLGPDGNLYFTSSNFDGRGTPKDGDDKIYKMTMRN